MKRYLIGIAAVFCVQIAFQTYLAIERSDNNFLSTTRPALSQFPPIQDGQLIADLTEPEVPFSVDMVSTSVKARHIKHSEPIGPSLAVYHKPRKAASTETYAAFKPVIIPIPSQSSSPSSERLLFDRKSEKVDQRTQKRSFPSKAVAVIKKPYDWLKIVASKLH
jgi:hypothetical protein